MAESKAVRISREYREQLVRNEDAALKRMSSYWAKMERATRDNMLLLAQEVTELKKAGQPVPVQYIYTMQRHMKMMEQLVELVPQYEYKALEEIEKTQRLNYTLGLESANAIIQASDPSDDMWTRIRQDAAEAMAGYAGNGAPLAELLQTDYGAMASRITDALVSGIGLGKGYKQVAQDMMDAAAIDFRRSVLIARTETNRAYRQANADQYRKSGVVEKVLRLCAMSNSCAACIIMDGWECKNGICEDHPNGKCTTVVVTTGGIMPEWEHGADWLERQDEATQREILGDGRYDLWKNYNIPLDQLVTMKENPVWGGSPALVSIADLKAKYNIIDVKKTLIDMQPKLEPEPEPKPSYTTVTTKEEAKDALSKMFGRVEDKFLKNNEDLIVKNTNQLLKLNNRFSALTSENRGFITNSPSGRAIGWTSSVYRKDREDTDLSLVEKYFKKPKVLQDEWERATKSFFNMPCSSENWDIYVVTHEYGHILENVISRKREDWNALEEKVSKFSSDFGKIRKAYRDAEKKQAKIIYEEIIDIAKKNNPDFKLSENLSRYGHTNHYEAFAEMFANSQLGDPNELGRAMQEWLRKEGF